MRLAVEQKAVHEIRILGDDDPLFLHREPIDKAILCGIGSRQVERVQTVVARVIRQKPGQLPGQLGIDQHP